MMPCEKEKFSYSFFIFLTRWHEFPAPKLTIFHNFISPLPLNVTLFLKIPYLIAHIKTNYETGCIRRFSEKKKKQKQKKKKRYIQDYRDIKDGALWAISSSFQLLTNFTKNLIIGAMWVLIAPLEYYNVFWNMCRWSN